MRRYCGKPCFSVPVENEIGSGSETPIGPGGTTPDTPPSALRSYMAIPPTELPVPEPGWRSDPRRGCVGLTDLFFPERKTARWVRADADAICASCPVLGSCRSWALLEADNFGRAAGTGPTERRTYRRRWRVKAPVMPSVDSVVNPILRGIELRRRLEAERLFCEENQPRSAAWAQATLLRVTW